MTTTTHRSVPPRLSRRFTQPGHPCGRRSTPQARWRCRTLSTPTRVTSPLLPGLAEASLTIHWRRRRAAVGLASLLQMRWWAAVVAVVEAPLPTLTGTRRRQ